MLSTITVMAPAKTSARRAIIRNSRHMPVEASTRFSSPAATPKDKVVTVITTRTRNGNSG